jgi:hypothetical protein
MPGLLTLCGSVGGNTRAIACGVSKGKFAQAAIHAGSLTSTEMLTLASIKSSLVADSRLSKNDGNKFFPLPPFQGKENKKESNQEQTLSNGYKTVVREGLEAWRMSFFASQALLDKLRLFNDVELNLRVQDNENKIWGEVASNGDFNGYRAKLFFEKASFQGDDTIKGLCYVNITFLETNAQEAYLQTDFSFSQAIEGLFDVQLFEKFSAVSNVLKVSGKVYTSEANSFLDIYPEYSTTLFVGALWKATNLTTGTPITITSVAPNAAGYGVLTLDNAAWTALPVGANVLIETVDPTALSTAGVVGIETAGFIYTKV